ncbi:MAG: cache domain-containing protein [Spirochaetaceae bacterium]
MHTMQLIPKSIKTKLTLTVAVIVLFYTLLLVFLTYGLFGEMARHNSIELADTVLIDTDKHITRFFENMEELALSFRQYPPVYEADPSRLRTLILANVGVRRSYMRAIYLGTEEGEMYEWGYGEGFVDNKPEFPPDYDPRERPWYRAAMETDGFAVTDPYLYASIEAMGITCVVPVDHPSGERVGVLGFDIMLDDLQTLVAEIDISMNGKALLIDKQGEPLVNQFYPGESSQLPAFADQWCAETKRGNFTAEAEDLSYFISYTENKVTGWSIFIGLPLQEVMAPTYRWIRISIALYLLLMILLLVTLEFSGHRMLIEPIEQMVDTIGRLRKGESGARTDLHRDDELGILARNFNRLADRVEEYTNEMEEKVKRRTDQLQKLQQENVRLRIIEEKERIYGYLHDSLGSRLTNIFISNNVARSVSIHNPKALEDMHNRIEENAQAGLDDLKEILSGSEEGYRSILDFRTLLDLQVRKRLELKEIDFSFGGDTDTLNTLDRGTAYEVEKLLQELVSNVLKHSEAGVVRLEMKMVEHKLIIHFYDDGKGFNTEEVGDESFGLANLRTRIHRRGGIFYIRSASGEGTEVTVELPLGGDRSW